MIPRENVTLSSLTTLTVGGPARYVLEARSPDEVREIVRFAREHTLPLVALGEGSNVLPEDAGYPGVVLLMRIPGIAFTEEGDRVLATIGAGVHWDDFVRAAAERELWGVENLAGIPGTVGAAPVQNIGAYGMELRQTFISAEVFDTVEGSTRSVPLAEAQFRYRDSRFKHEPNLIITGVTFALTRSGAPQVGYADLQKALEEGADVSNPGAIGDTVRRIREKKFPDLNEFGTAGSFFKNPILSPQQFAELSARYGAIPSFPADTGIKIPLAFVLDRVLGLKGYRQGLTFLFGKQPLVLVAERGARASDVDALAREIEARVREATGIAIEREVRKLKEHETK